MMYFYAKRGDDYYEEIREVPDVSLIFSHDESQPHVPIDFKSITDEGLTFTINLRKHPIKQMRSFYNMIYNGIPVRKSIVTNIIFPKKKKRSQKRLDKRWRRYSSFSF